MSPTTANRAQQGHLYLLNGQKVLALESGPFVRVVRINQDHPWLGDIESVYAVDLVPQPMKYFHGQIPA